MAVRRAVGGAIESRDNDGVDRPESSLSNWTPEQIAQGKAWVRAWQKAGPVLEKLRHEELRRLDPSALELLCGSADYHTPPRAPRPTSGLIEQQRWFMNAARRDGLLPPADRNGSDI